MYTLLTIIGARPQIIKAAALSRAIRKSFSDKITEKILHTGQHYDANMSDVFFSEMDIPNPDYNLHVGSGSHGVQTAKMIEGIEAVLLNEHFDGVVLYGDTNSTLAGAVAASKLNVPVFHIEAGLRSFNMTMPEEINRIVCDHISSLLFVPTKTGIANLKDEGFENEKCHFLNGRGRSVYLSGDIMYDNSLYYASLVGSKDDVLRRYALSPNNYVLATIHRNNNTDSSERLSSIISALLEIAGSFKERIIIPLHPRTSKLLQKMLSHGLFDALLGCEYITLAAPASYLEMVELEKNAKMVMTDSGGVQKEAYYFKKPCVILRPETEWVEIVEQGVGVLADADEKRIVEGYRKMLSTDADYPAIFGDGHSADFMLRKMVEYMDS